MSGVFKALGKIEGIAAAVLSVVPGLQPIAAAFAINSVVMSVVGNALASKPPMMGSSTSLTIGADQPTPMMIGDVYTGGAIVHRTGYGPTIDKVPNPYLAMAVVYSAGGPITAIDTYYADFQPLSFAGAANEATGYFEKILWQQTSLGPALQASALAGPKGAIPGWGSDAKLSGKPHVLWTGQWDWKKGKYQSGFPQVGIRGRGVPTWDPRADSTVAGGVGPQRWASPANTAAFDAAQATWAYTARPGLHALRYALGTWERDRSDASSKYVLTFGVGMPVDQIVIEDFAALETICEANNWEVSGVIKEPGDKWANLKKILECGGTQPCWKGGRLGLKLTGPRVSLDTITRADIAEGAMRAQGATGWRDVINAVVPKFTSPDHKWEPQQSTKIVVPALVAQDGEEKLREMPYEWVKRATQAAQLAAYALMDTREFGPIDIPVLPRLRGYRGGDRLTLDADLVAELGVPHGEIVVLRRAWDAASMTGVLTVMGETAAKHAFALGQVGTVPAAITTPSAADYDGATGAEGRQDEIDALSTLTAATGVSAADTGVLQATVTWRNPRSTSFDHAVLYRGGSAITGNLVGGLGATMTYQDTVPSAATYSYVVRVYADDGAYIDSAPVTVAVA